MARPIAYVVMLSDKGFNDAKQVFASIDLKECFRFCVRDRSLPIHHYEIQTWSQREGWNGTYIWNNGTEDWELQS